MKRFITWLLFAISFALLLPLAGRPAEITLTPEELALLKGERGPAGPAGPQGPTGPPGADGAPGTRITELAGICSADIGGEVFEWPCAAIQTEPPIEPEPPVEEPEPPPEPPAEPPPASCESDPYRGIPDPCVHLGYDIYANYAIDQVVSGDTGVISGIGTAADPYFVDARGLRRNGRLMVLGQYVIVQGGYVDYGRMDGPALGLGEGAERCEYCTIRDMEVFGDAGNFDAGPDAALGVGPDNVILRLKIHGFGDRRVSAREQDYHGIKTFGPNVWILDSEIYDVSGDSVQAGDASRGAATNVYIGGGYFHDNRENAVDIKDSQGVVVSGVRMEGFRPTASSGGVALVIHDDAFDARIYDNVISDTPIGIVSSGAARHVIEGNTITALLTGIELRNTANLTVRGNTIDAPTCVNKQSGVTGDVQAGCAQAGEATEPPPEQPTAPPADPDASGSHVLPSGRVMLVWTAPTHHVDCNTPRLKQCGEAIAAGAITRYRVFSRGANQDWTYDGTTTTANLRMTASGCYRVQAFIGKLGSSRSNELCLKDTE